MKKFALSLLTLACTASLATAQVTYDFTTSDEGWIVGGSGVSSTAAAWQHGSPGNPGGSPVGWFTTGQNSVGSFFVRSPVMTVLSAGQVTGTFLHRLNFESNFDGGQVQFRLNGGAWETITEDLITSVTYNATISAIFSSPIGGERAFSATSAGFATPTFVNSDFTLGTGASPYLTGSATNFAAGDQVEFRFFGAWDTSVVNASPNWHVTFARFNNVELVPIPEPATLLLGGLGMIGGALGVRRWRKRRTIRKGSRKHGSTAAIGTRS